MLQPDQLIDDRYRVIRPLGEGGMATVYLVRHERLQTLHALKLLRVSSDGIEARLLQEGRVQGRLDHPHIVDVTDVVLIAGKPALVMQYVAGPSLAELLATRRLTLEQCDHLARNLLRAVAHAHRHGLVHRDLKPHNVLLKVVDDVVVPMVTDFGLVKLLDDHDHHDGSGSQTRSGAVMGTPAYMAPEQARSTRDVDRRADIFALGAILYELVTGERAFRGPDPLAILMAVAQGHYVPVVERAPDTPPRMIDAVCAALQVAPGARPASCEALAATWSAGTAPPPDAVWAPLLAALRDAQATHDAPTRTVTDGPSQATATWDPATRSSVEETRPVPAPRGRRRWLALAAGTSLVALAGLVGTWSVRPTTARYAGLDLSSGVPTPIGAPLAGGAGVDLTFLRGRVVRAAQVDVAGRAVPLTAARPLGLNRTGERFWTCLACEISGHESLWTEPPFVAEWIWRWGDPVQVDYFSAGRLRHLARGRFEAGDGQRVVRYTTDDEQPALSPLEGVPAARYAFRGDAGPRRIVETRWFDATGTRQVTDREGAFGASAELDAHGRPVVITLLDAHDEPTWGRTSPPVRRLTWDDASGRLARVAWEGFGHVPALGPLGCEVENLTWRSDGRLAATRCTRASGEAMLADDGCAGVDVAWRDDTATLSCVDVAGAPQHDIRGVHALRLDHAPTRLEVSSLGADGRLVQGSDGVARIVRTFDAHGAELGEVRYDHEGAPVLDAEGMSGFRVERDPASGAVAAWVFLGAEAEERDSARGHARMAVTRDERHLPIELVYLAEDGGPGLSAGAYHRETYAFDAQRLLREFWFYDAEGAPAVDWDRSIHGGRLDYDAHRLVVQWTYLGRDREPVVARHNGGHIKRITRDALGREVQEAVFGLGGEPVVGVSGCHAASMAFDARGNRTARRCVDPQGHLMAREGRPALDRYTYDDRGRTLSTAHFDAQEQPMIWGCHRVVATRDERGRVTSTTCEDTAGQPMLREAGYAIDERVYDDRGFVVEARMLDANGEPVNGSGGWHRRLQVPDARGYRVETRFIAADDTPVTTDRGQLYRTRHDAAGRLLQESWHLADGTPWALPDGRLRERTERDARGHPIRIVSTPEEPAPPGFRWVEERDHDTSGRLVEARHLDPSGELVDARADGPEHLAGSWARQVLTRSPRGDLLEIRARDASDRPVRLASGISGMKLTWRAGHVVSVRYLGADGAPARLASAPWASPSIPEGLDHSVHLGAAGADLTWDARHRLTTVTRVDTDGQPFATGATTIERTWRPDGQLGEVRWLDRERRPADNAQGIARVELRYDLFGRLADRVGTAASGASVPVPAGLSLE